MAPKGGGEREYALAAWSPRRENKDREATNVSKPTGVLPIDVRSSVNVRIRTSTPSDIDPLTAQAWSDLERRAVEGNAYLSPHFLIPAAHHLRSGAPLLVVLIETQAAGTHELIGVGVFEHSGPTKRFPLPHLRAFHSRHSFLAGLLLDNSRADEALTALLQFFSRRGSIWHGAEFRVLPGEGPLHELLQQALVRHDALWVEYDREQRAILLPPLAGERYVSEQMPNERRKDLRRRLRRLRELGEVSWRATAGAEVTDAHVESFLDLEHRGWKGQDGTSLRSHPADEAFFRQMIAGFRAQGRVIFTELCLAGRPIASTANLISGNAGFAFKLGWDPAHAKMAPGLLNEVELIRHAPRLFPGITHIDSGAAPGSFMEELWVTRRELVSGAFAVTPLGKSALYALRQAARVRRSFTALRRRFISLAAILASLWGSLAYTLYDPS